MSSSSSVATPSVTPRPTVMNPALLRRVVELLNEYLDTLKAEQEAIEVDSSYTHDEMAAEDNHWDELDAQIGEVSDVLQELGYPVHSDDTDNE
jgi:SpoVK/Ycf46/Vps4 family AAA+-type ATPase